MSRMKIEAHELGTRTMTERAAWLHLAKAWRKAEPDMDGVYEIDMGDGDAKPWGLCYSVTRMRRTEMIGDGVARRMYARVEAAAARLGLDDTKYLWPTTLAGARARVRFCERQARALGKAGAT